MKKLKFLVFCLVELIVFISIIGVGAESDIENENEKEIIEGEGKFYLFKLRSLTIDQIQNIRIGQRPGFIPLQNFRPGRSALVLLHETYLDTWTELFLEYGINFKRKTISTVTKVRAVVDKPQHNLTFPIPFLPSLDIDISGLSLQAIMRAMRGWGFLNFGADVDQIIFTLGNKANGYKDQKLNPDNPSTFFNSTWDKTQKTIVVIHGYTEDGSGGPLSNTKQIIKAYSDVGRPENLVFVDWSYLSRQLNYFNSARNTYAVGLRVSMLLVYLKGAGLVRSMGDVRLVGFSLGAHVSGVAAYFTSQVLKEKVDRITGLDPAGPGFRLTTPDTYRLGPEDADFVDVIHTNMGKTLPNFGTDLVSGHVDFFPNGGDNQPGCDGIIDGLVASTCNHLMALNYFARTIRGNSTYNAYECKDWQTFSNGGCPKTNPAVMGEFVDKRTRGLYFLAIPLGQ